MKKRTTALLVTGALVLGLVLGSMATGYAATTDHTALQRVSNGPVRATVTPAVARVAAVAGRGAANDPTAAPRTQAGTVRAPHASARSASTSAPRTCAQHRSSRCADRHGSGGCGR